MIFWRRFRTGLWQCLLVLVLAGSLAAEELAVTTLVIGDQALQTELAVTPEQRNTGLMHREHLPPDAAMLFVYAATGQRCFWMHNTLIPLTLAFLADDGTVLQLVDMTPQSRDVHCSAMPVQYALEVNQGWFEQHGLGLGDRVQGLP
ncbi:DUF192 domain-containing protein [Natronospirillum operosum]|uniref:DUF192 domain-containing protein n=1 Tax=Natronospirillum operosum TaxID=2759953 RepID=A0A4Z0WCK0_9GAMM|nr:DUF192 domain-containing protein [Natronospirillum operosum]TGG95932.1 DUF192 domain-containing protein [Natronospirillum operosum]